MGEGGPGFLHLTEKEIATVVVKASAMEEDQIMNIIICDSSARSCCGSIYVTAGIFTIKSKIMMFFLIHILYCHSPCIHLLYDFIVFRLLSYHIDAEVAQKGT
jgi:hypothetical protein